MNHFFAWLENKFLPPMAKLAEQRHLQAIRDGIIATLPLIIIGSFFLILANPPVEGWAQAIAPYKEKIVIPYYLSMGLLSLYASFSMGQHLAISYRLDGLTGGLLSAATFLMTFLPLQLDHHLPVGQTLGMLLPLSNMGGKGLFLAILATIFAVEILRLFHQTRWTIQMPSSVPSSVARSFSALVPASIIILTIWVLRVWLNIDLLEVLKWIFQPLTYFAGNTFLGSLIPVLFIMLLWSIGIHGSAVIGTFFQPIWFALLEENAAAAALGQPMPNPVVEPFFQWFVFIGGSGTTIALVILLLFSKSPYLKHVGRVALIPSIFNINEPVAFGVPMILNPFMFIPFIFAPITCTITTYLAYTFDWVHRIAVYPPWTLPAPIGAFLATGGDWRAVVLLFFNVILAGLIYYPFFKAYEKKMLITEK